jgi:hypothetical protein
MLPTAATAAATRTIGAPGASAHPVAQLCMPDEFVVPFGARGEMVVRPRLLEEAETQAWRQSPPVGERFCLTCAGGISSLIVEPPLAAAVVAQVLGLALSVGAPLTRIEKGVLTGALAAMLSQVGLAPSVRIGECRPADPAALFLAFAVELSGKSGQGWLLATDGLLDAAWRRWPGFGPASDIELELAETAVATAELEDAAIGDLIVFDGVAGARAEVAWPVIMRRGDRRMAALWMADDSLVIAAASAGMAGVRPSPPAAGSPAPPAAAPATARVIALCPVETASLTWKGPFVQPRDGRVVLLAGGTSWARGQVVARDGDFTVAITSLSGTERRGSR